MRRAIALLLLAAAVSDRAASARGAVADVRPNILVIMTDDQSHDTLTDQFMPRTTAAITDQGVTCTHAYVTTALCCPSRASFLTGRYARHTGVHGNDDPLDDPTVAERLHAAGYETALVGKYLKEASRVPFAVRYPRLAPTPRAEPRLVANVDLAPTMYDLAGLPVPAGTDGRSLVPLLSGEAVWRDALLLEGWPDHDFPQAYQALRTGRFVYVENDDDLPELYDVESDPFQMENLAAEPAHAADVADLHERLLNGRF